MRTPDVSILRKRYPVGTRIVCDRMNDDPYPVPNGTEGTVEYVDDAGQIHVKWKTGSSLALVPGVDEFHTI